MKLCKRLILAFFIMTPLFGFGGEPLDVGAAAPAITVSTHAGADLDLGELYEKGPVAVYFYPKSDTPGCTRQACNLRDNFDDLSKAGITVVGVSSDAVDKQAAFVTKYDLPFVVVADTDLALGKAFGVSRLAGTIYARQTFLVVDGKIAWRDLKAKPGSQSETLLTALKAAQGSK